MCANFSDKTIIITGASAGIGRALALQCATARANLVLNARHESPLIAITEECQNLVGSEAASKISYVSGDIADSAVAAKAIKVANRDNNLWGIIHAAGVLAPGPFVWELKPHDFLAVVQASFIGAYQLIHHSYPVLLKRKSGVMVLFGSKASELLQPGIGAYCATKAAEESLAKLVAAETPEIACFIYRPGIVETRMQQQARESIGGGAESLHKMFRPWQSQNLLATPAQSAAKLLSILQNDPYAYHGKIVNY